MNENPSSRKYAKDSERFVFILLFVIAAVVAVIVVFSVQMKKLLDRQNMQYLESGSANAEKYIDTIFANSKQNIENISLLYSEKLTSPDVDFKDFSAIEKTSPFTYVRFINRNGIGTDSEGLRADLSDRIYFKLGMEGKTGVEPILKSRFYGEAIFVFYAPLYFEGKVIGVFLGILNNPVITSYLKRSIFDEEALVYLCLKDGTVFATSKPEMGSNIPDNFIEYSKQKKNVSEKTIERLKACFEDGTNCYFALENENGKDEIAYAIKNKNDSWILVQMFPANISEKMRKSFNSIIITVELICGILFVLYILYFFISEMKQRRTSDEVNWKIIKKGTVNLADTISVLSDYYYKVLKIYLKTGDYEIIKSQKDEKKKASTVSEWVNEVVSTGIIADENKEEFIEFCNSEKITKEFLAGQERLSIRYKRLVENRMRWVKMEIKKSTEFSEENPVVILYVLDINDDVEKELALKEAYEAATKANTAKTTFLSNMSHDIRTPMNAILGMTAIANVHLDDKERVADCLSKITVSSNHLLGLINEVLDMSKIESGKIDLQDEEFDISELIDNILTICRNLVKEKNHQLNIVVDNIMHEKVIGDAQRIQQVFLNLISNAIKYTPNGGKIDVTITERQTEKKQIACYEFTFQDNGIGMSEDFQKHLFEPFVRAENDERVLKQQGTGLGMPITKNIVQMMNGSIKVKSKLNEGTKFTVTIFLRVQETNDSNIEKDFKDLPILVVDDDMTVCESTKEILNSLGMNANYVTTGRDACNLVEQGHKKGEDYFAIILDWKMPEMDGLQTAKEIFKLVGDKTPIIIASAFDWSEIELEARNIGINDFISKPIFKSKLTYLFKKLLGHDDATKKQVILQDFKEADFSGKRILLVEDNDMNAEIATEILKMTKLEIERVENGKEAVEKFASVQDDYYSIIFMDIQMPIMNGYDAARGIRAQNREYAKRVPIIAMTANAFSDDIVAAKDAGMNEHIAKPLKLDIILKTLHKYLT